MPKKTYEIVFRVLDYTANGEKREFEHYRISVELPMGLKKSSWLYLKNVFGDYELEDAEVVVEDSTYTLDGLTKAGYNHHRRDLAPENPGEYIREHSCATSDRCTDEFGSSKSVCEATYLYHFIDEVQDEVNFIIGSMLERLLVGERPEDLTFTLEVEVDFDEIHKTYGG